MMKYEYREPEFKVIRTAKEDVLTASQQGVQGLLTNLTDDWDTGAGNNGGVGFGV